MTAVECSCRASVPGVAADGVEHGVDWCVRTSPLFQVPQAFVNLADSDAFVRGPATLVFEGGSGEPVAEFVEFDPHRNSFVMSVSREMALDYGLVVPTPAERAQRDADAAAFRARQAAERALPGPDLTLEALLGELAWTPAYAAHFLHPACSCDPTGDDPYLCDWARELGFTDVGSAPAPTTSPAPVSGTDERNT